MGNRASICPSNIIKNMCFEPALIISTPSKLFLHATLHLNLISSGWLARKTANKMRREGGQLPTDFSISPCVSCWLPACTRCNLHQEALHTDVPDMISAIIQSWSESGRPTSSGSALNYPASSNGRPAPSDRHLNPPTLQITDLDDEEA